MADVDPFVPSLEVRFPYPRPIAPHQRELKQASGDLHLLVRRPAVEECFCIEHGPTAELAYTRYIHRKDQQLYDRLDRTRRIMAQRAASIIGHPCPDIDTKMDVLYAIDYDKRGHDTRGYKCLFPARDSGVGSPLHPLRYEIMEDVLINPDFYPHLPKLRKIVAPRRSLQYDIIPKSVTAAFAPERGVTQYEEDFSVTGMARMRNSRFYLEPQPTSRLRADDFHL